MAQDDEGAGGEGGGKLVVGAQMELKQGLSEEDREAGAVCLCSPDVAPCYWIAPSLWMQMKPLSHLHLLSSSQLLPHSRSLGCKCQEGGQGLSWTREEGYMRL